jgi:DNA-binding MarR family transcriptional regulator
MEMKMTSVGSSGSAEKMDADSKKSSDGQFLDLSIDQSIAQLMRSLARDFTRALERRLASHDITIGMWFPLRILWEHDGIDQHELQKLLGQAQPTIVKAMERLEKQGLIERYKSQKDGRRISVHLTGKGQALKHDVLHFATEVQDTALKEISQEEVRQLLDIFSRIKRSLMKDRVF